MVQQDSMYIKQQAISSMAGTLSSVAQGWYGIDMPGKKIFDISMLKKWQHPHDASYFFEEVHGDIDAADEDIPIWKEVECETTPTVGKQMSKKQRDQLFDKVMRSRLGWTSAVFEQTPAKPVRQQPNQLPHGERTEGDA